MKKYSILLVVVLVASLFVSQGVSGQSIEWVSGFQVQNLNDSEDASVLISYYNQDGTLAIDPPVADTILAGKSENYYPIHPSAGFNGSVVVEGPSIGNGEEPSLAAGSLFWSSRNPVGTWSSSFSKSSVGRLMTGRPCSSPSVTTRTRPAFSV